MSPQTLNGQSYVFGSWAHGGPADAAIFPGVDTTYAANTVLGHGETFNDTFDRPDSPDLGNGWLEVSEGLSISANGAAGRSHQGPLPDGRRAGFQQRRADRRGELRHDQRQQQLPAGVLPRYQGQNYYLVSRSGGTSLGQISRFVNGIETVLATALAIGEHVLPLESQANGTTLTRSGSMA